MDLLPIIESDPNNLLFTLAAVLGIQLAAFAGAAIRRTDTLTDITYAATFALLAVALLVGGGRYELPRLLVCALVLLWALRLGGYLLLRVLRTGRDERFDGIREHPFKFAGFWTLQAVTIWTVLLPVTMLLSHPGPLQPGWPLWLGAGLWLVGFVVETVADQQKFAFRNDPANRGRWIERGLWRYSRHPNYFGELLCWWGLFVAAVPALDGWEWLALLGPIFLTVLLLFVSGIPTVRRKQQQRYGHDPAFQDYLKRTSLLIPLPPRSGA
jgi:steroid 5-alpha reductase family enzyme